MSTTRKNPAAKAARQVEDVVAAHKESVETVVKAGAEAAKKNYEKAVAVTKEQVEAAVKASADVFKGYEELAVFGKENVDAVVKSGTVFAKGMQDLNKVWFGFAKEALENNASAAKRIFGCKTPQEMVAVQNELAKANYEKLVTGGREVSELTVKLAEEVVAPISARMNVAVERISKPLAA